MVPGIHALSFELKLLSVLSPISLLFEMVLSTVTVTITMITLDLGMVPTNA